MPSLRPRRPSERSLFCPCGTRPSHSPIAGASHARALSAAARAAAPTVIAALVVIAVVALVADAQQVSSKPIEEVALNWRNWLITKIVPTAGAAVLSWNALETKTGHREGFGKLTRGFVSLLIGLGAAGVVSSAASLVQ